MLRALLVHTYIYVYVYLYYFFERLEASFIVKSLDLSISPQIHFFRKLCRPNKPAGELGVPLNPWSVISDLKGFRAPHPGVMFLGGQMRWDTPRVWSAWSRAGQ